MGLTFLVGGARSGKSALAVDLARQSRLPVTFIATSPADGDDDEWTARIARHRAERPDDWHTVEEPVDLVGSLGAAAGTVVVVDCLTLWVSNLMWDGRSDADIDRLSIEAATAAATRTEPVVAVSNEVGMGVHPDTVLTRRYRDALGRVNQHWSAAASDALLLVAGRAIRLDDPRALLR